MCLLIYIVLLMSSFKERCLYDDIDISSANALDVMFLGDRRKSVKPEETQISMTCNTPILLILTCAGIKPTLLAVPSDLKHTQSITFCQEVLIHCTFFTDSAFCSCSVDQAF